MSVFVRTSTRFDTRRPPARPDRVVYTVEVIIGGIAFITDVPSPEDGRKLVMLVTKALGLDEKEGA